MNLSNVSRWFVAVVFLIAGVSKLFEPSSFAAVLEQISFVSDGLQNWIALWLPSFEVVCAVSILSGRRYWIVAGTRSLQILLLLFVCYWGHKILGNDNDACSCFGGIAEFGGAWGGLARCLVLLALTFAIGRVAAPTGASMCGSDADVRVFASTGSE